ncbi:MAG TPA: hypothetical protein VMT34_06300 [Aggregatilineales bacterium]|nr:hypothetical protein [Aggregatilineales bacterium]
MAAEQSPCRLFVILAREASKAVIFRRGPSRWRQLILWDTRTDTFVYGQWFRGRIYERRCDLSPDGSKLIYFAAKHGRSGPDALYSWTAISIPPYYTALALWPKSNSWAGGGLFVDENTVWLNHRDEAKPHKDHMPPKTLKIMLSEGYGEDSPIYNKRLKRDGWDLIQQSKWIKAPTALTLTSPPSGENGVWISVTPFS